MSKRIKIFAPIFTLALMLLAHSPSVAQEGLGKRGIPVGLAEHRIALVVGNSTYDKGHLANPVNDARGVAEILEGIGFEVIRRENATFREMRRAVIDFGERMDRAGVRLFYFAGHGVQVRGRNYLIPVDAHITKEAEVEVEGLGVESVLARMTGRGDRLNIVILDACRDNPYERSFRSGGANGLATINPPRGSVVAFATGPNQVAVDGQGRHSPYTAELIKHVARPGVRLVDVFNKVRVAVQKKTKGRQRPMEWFSLEDAVYLAGGPEVAVNHRAVQRTRVDPPKPEPVEPESATGEVEVTSNVDGTEFELAGRRYQTKAGSTLIISRVPVGEHQITARKEGHKDWQGLVRIEATGRAKLTIELEEMRAGGKYLTNSIGMKFAKIPGLDLYLGIYEVTIAQFLKYLNQSGNTSGVNLDHGNCPVQRSGGGYQMKRDPGRFWGSLDQPMLTVSWHGAREFIAWLNAKEGTDKYRLPTKAEWEYACKAGGNGKWCFGDDESKLGDYAWYRANSNRRTNPVGRKRASAYGLYDIHGNVWEWCQENGAIRGGSWINFPDFACCTFRDGYYPSDSNIFVGFRLAREP